MSCFYNASALQLCSAADSVTSCRPRLTLEPLSQATGLPIQTEFKDKEYADLVERLENTKQGDRILICWHHGEIPKLLNTLGINPKTPSSIFAEL